MKPNIAWQRFCKENKIVPTSFPACSKISFSPKLKTGTKSAPSLIAIFTKPNCFSKIKSLVPGRAWRASPAPPMTIVIEAPGPEERICLQDFEETSQIPRERIKSLWRGILKLLARVRRWGLIPGNNFSKPVAEQRRWVDSEGKGRNTLCTEICYCAHSYDTMRMITKDVGPSRI